MSLRLPSAAFRNKPTNVTIERFRLYKKTKGSKKFSWFGSFESKEEALKVFNRVFTNNECEFVIKRIVVKYEEDVCAQSFKRDIAERLPEIAGMI